MFGQFPNAYYGANPAYYNGKPTTVSPVPFTSINCVLDATDQSGGLYIGDVMSIKRPEILAGHRIKAILCCGEQAKSDVSLIPYKDIDEYKVIMAKDMYDYDISQHFDESYQFIDKHLKAQRNTLVHCHAGVSRSAAIVTAYLMRKNGWGVDQALAFLRARRPRAKPNSSFMNQLKTYEAQLFGLQTPEKTHSMQQTSGSVTDRSRTPQKRTASEIPKAHSRPQNDYMFSPQGHYYTPPTASYPQHPYYSYPHYGAHPYANLNRNLFNTPPPQPAARQQQMYTSRFDNYPLGNVYLNRQPMRNDTYVSRFAETMGNAAYI